MDEETATSSSGGAGAGHRLAGAYRSVALMALNTGLLLLLVELGASAVARWSSICDKPRSEPGTLTERAVGPESLSYYTSRPWGRAFWVEHRATESVDRYAPYVVWKTAPHQGRYLNISTDHVRQTPGADCVSGAYRVFVLGGSTIWGWGSPDSGTIPAHLQVELARRRTGPVCVVNLGQNAFVSTQELIELIQHLQRNDVPDLALFYGGFNDAYAAFASRRPGVHYMARSIAAEFERHDNALRPTIFSLVRTTGAYRLLQKCVAVRRSVPAAARIPPPAAIDDTTRRLAEAVLALHLQNYRIVESLATTYGFQFAFFWQPSQFAGNKPLSPEEQTMRPQDAGSVPLITAIYQGAEDAVRHHPNYYYLGNIFAGDSTSTYIDYVHVTPDGNAKIARAIADVLIPPVPAQR